MVCLWSCKLPHIDNEVLLVVSDKTLSSHSASIENRYKVAENVSGGLNMALFPTPLHSAGCENIKKGKITSPLFAFLISVFFSEFSEFRKTSDQQCCCILYRFISRFYIYMQREHHSDGRRQKGLIKIFI